MITSGITLQKPPVWPTIFLEFTGPVLSILFLRGNFDQALKQLEYGLPLVRRNFQLETKMKQKIAEIEKLKEN